ncbi:MAG: T9SS type A sorting domain-containing protein [Flavobacteriaceae bacterium]
MRTKKKSDILLKKTTLEIFCFFTAILIGLTNSFAQTQVGNDVDGEAEFDQFGQSVSMPDSNTIAVGAPFNDDNGLDSGQVRIYFWNGTNWEQKSNDINGESEGDQSGQSVSMPDSNTIAIGAPFNGGNGLDSGHVRVYSWNGTNWEQKGNDIDGESDEDQSGKSVSMPDSDTIAIGAPFNDNNGLDSGHVRIYFWNGTNWEQKGNNIEGDSEGDEFGQSVSMPDSDTIAIGAPNTDDSGQVRVYSWNGTNWEQKGADINAEGVAQFDNAGYSVSMPDDETIAVGAPLNDGINGFNSGHVRIYGWNGTNWEQKGDDIDGEDQNDFSGESVTMPDANTVAIGATRNDGSDVDSGHVRIYIWNGSIWEQIGEDIDGEAELDLSGFSVCMPDISTVAIGAPFNDGNGTISGHVRVFDLSTLSLIEVEQSGFSIEAFPNPFKDYLTLKAQSPIKSVRVYSILGQIVFEESNFNVGTLTINLSSLSAGKYFVKIHTEEGTFSKKIIKE